MDNPLYMPKGWRAGSVRLQPTVAHEEGGATYVKGFNGAGGGVLPDGLLDEDGLAIVDESNQPIQES
jgi:hypothetical protein